MPARGPARQSGSSSPKEVSPGRRRPGYSRVGYADAVRHGRQVTVITFWSGIGGDVPDGPLIFCACAGIRDKAAGSARQAVSLTASPAGPLPPGCIGQVMPEAWVGSAGAG